MDKNERHYRRPRPCRDTAGTAALRSVLEREGISMLGLARRLNFHRGTVRNWFFSGCNNHLIRRRVEAVLGYRHTIWTSAGVLADRARCVRMFGFDPEIVSWEFMLAETRRRGVRWGVRPLRRVLVDWWIGRAKMVEEGMVKEKKGGAAEKNLAATCSGRASEHQPV